MLTSLYPLLTRWGMRGYRRVFRCPKGDHRDAMMSRRERCLVRIWEEDAIVNTYHALHDVMHWRCIDCGRMTAILAVVPFGLYSNHTTWRDA